MNALILPITMWVLCIIATVLFGTILYKKFERGAFKENVPSLVVELITLALLIFACIKFATYIMGVQ